MSTEGLFGGGIFGENAASGSNGEVQYNLNGNLAGDSDFVRDPDANTLRLADFLEVSPEGTKIFAPVDAITGSSNTLSADNMQLFQLVDSGQLIIPNNSDGAIEINREVEFVLNEDLPLEFIPSAGVTIHSPDFGLSLFKKNTTARLKKTATDTWYLNGDVEPLSPYGLTLWLDGADTNAFATSSSLISKWFDKSGLGNHATASGSGRPTLTLNALNGNSGVTFNGSANFMTLPAGVFNIPNGESTIYVVAQSNENTADRYVYCMIGGGGAAKQFITSAANTDHYLTYNGGYLATPEITKSDPNIVTYYTSGTTEAATANLGSYNTDANAAYDVATSAVLGSYSGSGNFFSGKMYEIIMYNYKQSDTLIALTNRQLAYKWNIALD